MKMSTTWGWMIAGAFVSLAGESNRSMLAQAPRAATTSAVRNSSDSNTTIPDLHIATAAMTAEGYIAELNALIKADGFTRGQRPVIGGQIVLRTDSLGQFIDSLVQARISALQHQPVASRYLVSLAQMQWQLSNDTAAQRLIETWLKTPGITLGDTIGAIGFALRFLEKREITLARVALARTYAERLEVLPRQKVVGALVFARWHMMHFYAALGQADSAVAWGLRGFALLPEMSYESRALVLMTPPAFDDHISPLAILLAGQPNGFARKDSLLAVLRSYAPVPPALLAKDTALQRLSEAVRENMSEFTESLKWLGRPMPPLVATHWFNISPPSVMSDVAPGARVLPLDDGVIRIVGFGWFTCPGCHASLGEMQKASLKLQPGVQIVYNEKSQGFWRDDVCTPEEEAEQLRRWWLDRRHYTLPITIWAPVKDSTPGGGWLPRPSPTWTALHIYMGPTIYVVDGHGIIRYMQGGFQGYEKGVNPIYDVVEMIRAEHAHGTPSRPVASRPFTCHDGGC